jgi:hypothetical protein
MENGKAVPVKFRVRDPVMKPPIDAKPVTAGLKTKFVRYARSLMFVFGPNSRL